MRIGISYFGCRKPSHVTEELANWRKKGISFVVFTYSENDLLFYRKTMAVVFHIAHELGLTVWADPWGVGGIFSGETPSWFLLYHPDAWQVRSDGVRVPHACPNAPFTRQFLHEWIDAVAEAGAEWILWDEPHWYIPGVSYWPGVDRTNLPTCYCHHCQEKFRTQFHRDMPNQEHEDLNEFRRSSMRALLTDVTTYASSQGIKNAVCWAPPEQFATGLELEDILKMEYVDKLAIDPYWLTIGRNVQDFFVPTVQRIIKLCEDKSKPLQVWLQGFRVPRGREEELLEAAEILIRSKVQEVAVWHHQWMSSLLPDDPPKVDRVVDEMFARFSGK